MFKRLLLLLLAASIAPVAASEQHRVTGAVDISLYHVNGDYESWLHGGSGKLRYDEDHEGLRSNRIFIDYRGRVTDTLWAQGVLNMNNDVSEKLDVTEAFLEWRPMPASAWRFRSKIGAFYPRISVENVEAGWSNAYGLTSSAINTWIGEEMRTIGAELKLIRDLPNGHQLSAEGAMFYANDPIGAILAWRGWAVHDRQTGLSGSIPMPEDSSAIYPWRPDGAPLRKYEPFEEIDNKAGFYTALQWRWGERIMIKGFHYDNHADPEARSGDEYAWNTWFDHVSAQAALPFGFGLLGQWIDGKSMMGPDLGPWRVQDIEFESTFMTLTKTFDEHRFAVRYEWFDLQPYNDPPGITNQDKGNALAVSWLYQMTPRFRIAAEYMQIRSDHCKQDSCLWTRPSTGFFPGYGLEQKTKDSQVQLSVRWHFAGTAL